MSLLDTALFLTRAAVLIIESALFGTLAVSAFAERNVGRRLINNLFLALLLLLPTWLAVQSATMAEAHGIAQVFHAIVLVLTASWVGHLTIFRAVAWVLTWVVLIGSGRGSWSRNWAMLPAGLALALHAGAGHAVATGDNWLFASVLIHVFAASSWVGGLPALWLALDGRSASALVSRYTWYGVVCVALVAITATAQTLVLGGGVIGLIGTDYGHVILLKIVLLALLLVLAFRHRFILGPRLPRSLPALRRSVLVEVGLGVAVLCAASLLSSLPPGAHDQPTWPFAYRLSFDLMDDVELRREVMGAALALGGAALLVLLAILARRVRWFALAAAAGITWFAVPHLDLLLAPTEPTYYAQSTTGFTPDSIALGRQTYEQNCVSCHGAGGAGDGKVAQTLRIPPADLTAPHLWDHPEGELFWWIKRGVNGPDGKLVMPGYATTLDDETIWSLIDFLHANNPNKPDGVSLGAPHHHR